MFINVSWHFRGLFMMLYFCLFNVAQPFWFFHNMFKQQYQIAHCRQRNQLPQHSLNKSHHIPILPKIFPNTPSRQPPKLCSDELDKIMFDAYPTFELEKSYIHMHIRALMHVMYAYVFAFCHILILMEDSILGDLTLGAIACVESAFQVKTT